MQSSGRIWGELFAWTLVAGSACVMLSHQDLLDAEAVTASLHAGQDELAQGHATVSSEQIDQVRQRALSAREQIAECSSFQRNETALYGRLSEIAKSAGVRVDQLVPSANSSAQSSSAPEVTSGKVVPLPGDSRSTYTMTIVGGYAPLSAFMRRIEHDVGYSVIRSARLAPLDGSSHGLIRAVLVTDHFALDAGPVSTEGTP